MPDYSVNSGELSASWNTSETSNVSNFTLTNQSSVSSFNFNEESIPALFTTTSAFIGIWNLLESNWELLNRNWENT
jgi:hypothetical protein